MMTKLALPDTPSLLLLFTESLASYGTRKVVTEQHLRSCYVHLQKDTRIKGTMLMQKLLYHLQAGWLPSHDVLPKLPAVPQALDDGVQKAVVLALSISQAWSGRSLLLQSCCGLSGSLQGSLQQTNAFPALEGII